ncbi:flagellar biosynthetic protein FliO [Pannonibacter tanglangensis]|uniref:Flagellar biosynthesis protein FliO n=1 Tax=Pannonibacter tanglangensis TaxID=2750084 RepID=A0ABW9ZHY4_9HYPH|nr:flagellar biosynthetic protein FliO [Pannonibacter sp. XCT-34]NBN63547.1 hypothetical protein [Pannonibacter sp. XCT-34]
MYEWIAETFGVGEGIAKAMSFIIALAIVFGLIGLVLFVLRQLTGNRIATGRNRQPRIAVMDAMHIDTRRRLLLVRRDNVEHLILVGGPTDVVVEQAIVRGTPVSASYPRQAQVGPQYGTPPYEGESDPYAAQQGWAPQPVAPQPVAAAAGLPPQPQMSAPQPVEPVAPVAPAPAARASSLRQSPQEAALAALRGRSTTPRIEEAPQDPDSADNVKSLRPRIAALTEPLRRVAPDPQGAPQPAPRPASAPSVAAPQAAAMAPSQAQAQSQVQSQQETSRAAVRATEGLAAAASSLTSKAGSSVAAAGAAVADLARSLSRSSERTAPVQEPEVKRQLTPPSSGPAARARTAYPNALAAQSAPADTSAGAEVKAADAAAPQAPAPDVRSPAQPQAAAQVTQPQPQAAAQAAQPQPQAAPVQTSAPTVRGFAGFPAQPRPQAGADSAAQAGQTVEPVAAAPAVSLQTPPQPRPAAIGEVRLTPPAPASTSVAAPVGPAQVQSQAQSSTETLAQSPAQSPAQVQATPAAPAISSEVRLTPLGAAAPAAVAAATGVEAEVGNDGASDDIFDVLRPEPRAAATQSVAEAATLAELTVAPPLDAEPVAQPLAQTQTPPVVTVAAQPTPAAQVIPEIRLSPADLVAAVSQPAGESAAPDVAPLQAPGRAPAVEVSPAPANRDEAGVNAIEEEMARLLSEIGVQGRK